MSHTTTERKRLLHDLSEGVYDATVETIDDLLADHYHDDAEWYGPKPVDELTGVDAIAGGYWEPLLEAFPDLERTDYLLFAGEFEGDEWVCASGNLVGTFEDEWLGIPATGQATWLRFGEFHRIEGGKIAETRHLVDVLDVMRQAGYRFFPALAPEVVIPGPATQDGVLLDGRDADDSRETLRLVEEMLDELGTYEEKGLDGMALDEYWHEDFMWYGPAGTGTTRGIDGFQEYHQGPFLEGFPDREGGNHVARFAEGEYCASTGWPSITATHVGDDWMGLPATDQEVTMRVMDFWRREDDLLRENWVFIDTVDLLDQLGVDVLDRVRNDRQYL